MSDPKISVVIPCYNAGRWIRETLNSVVSQKYENIEIIVVDDGSTDSSNLIIEKEFPCVKLMKTENHGGSRARNIGTEASVGEFIQYIDADDLLAKGKLKLQARALSNNGADVAYGDWQRLVKNSNGEYVKGEIVKIRLQNPEIDLVTGLWSPLAAYLFRRSIVNKIGGWNESLPITGDSRFPIDCALRGAEFLCCPGIMAQYRVHETNSYSTRDRRAFIRDGFKNASQVEAWWQNHGGIKNERLNALLRVYGYFARSTFQSDPETFELAYQSLERLSPNYIPDNPKHLRVASLLLGYRKAEALAVHYRAVKDFLHSVTNIIGRR